MASNRPQAVEIERLTRRFGDVTALDQVQLSIEQGEFFSLLGPSGCGKTTLLRIIAGLEIPDEGVVRIGGQDAASLPAHRRPVNTVFQSYALFPHLSVWDNVAFGLRMKKVPRPDLERRVRQVMQLVEIEALGARRPDQLSGGQKQRVALARAVVNEPSVLLLDEPLGALDLKLRKQLQVELRRWQRRLGMTFIYVTHDQEEALVLSDRIAVMRQGKIEQIGPAQTIYERPQTRFVSQFLGTGSLLAAVLQEADERGARVQTALGRLLVTSGPLPGKEVTLVIRPEKVQLATAPGPGENWVRVRIEQVIYVGSETHYELRAGTELLRAEVMNSQAGAGGFGVGEDGFAYLPPDALIALHE